MGGEENTKSPLRGAFWDTVQTPERVASGGREGGKGRRLRPKISTQQRRGQRKVPTGRRGGDTTEIREDTPTEASN